MILLCEMFPLMQFNVKIYFPGSTGNGLYGAQKEAFCSRCGAIIAFDTFSDNWYVWGLIFSRGFNNTNVVQSNPQNQSRWMLNAGATQTSIHKSIRLSRRVRTVEHVVSLLRWDFLLLLQSISIGRLIFCRFETAAIHTLSLSLSFPFPRNPSTEVCWPIFRIYYAQRARLALQLWGAHAMPTRSENTFSARLVWKSDLLLCCMGWW